MRATRTQWHTAAGDVLQEEKKHSKEKPSWWKCPRGPYTSQLSISQLPCCWSKSICLRECSKGSAAQSFWKSTGSLLCLPAAWTASSQIINFCGQGRAKGRPGQPWINGISDRLREALPSRCNQSPLPRQRHINLSGKSFAFPSYPLSILRLPLCPSPSDVKAAKLKVLGYKLTSVPGSAIMELGLDLDQ